MENTTQIIENTKEANSWNLDFFMNIVNNILSYIDNIEFFVKFVIVYIAIIYIVLILRVMRDIVTRTNNIFYQLFCVVLILLTAPIWWIFLYLLARPSRTLNEKYYDEIEENLDIIEEIVAERKKEKLKKLGNKNTKKEEVKNIKKEKSSEEKRKSKIEIKKFPKKTKKV